jgi:hypothetical protein
MAECETILFDEMPVKCPCCGAQRLFSNGVVGYYDCGLEVYKVGSDRWAVDKPCSMAMQLLLQKQQTSAKI